MKKVKYILSIFIILICFILGGELFQNYVGSFSNQFYYFDLYNIDNREEVFRLLSEISDENDVGIFTVNNQTIDTLNYKSDIMLAEKASSILKSKYNISPGRYDSFFSGTTDITFSDFSEIINDSSIERYYFTGSIEQVRNIRNKVYDDFATSYVHKENIVGNEWLINVIWIISCLLLLLLTWLDIQFQKKENFILISLGVSQKRLLLKNIIFDLLSMGIIFLIIYFSLSRFIYVGYGLKYIIIIFGAFLLVNGLLFLNLLGYDYKKVLYGANLNHSTLSNCYVLKAFSMIVATASLAVNISLITENANNLSLYKTIDKFDNYGFLDMQWDSTDISDKDDAIELHENTQAQFFCDYYKKGKIALAVSDFNDEHNIPYLIVNQNSNHLIEKRLLDKIESDKDFYIFVPKNYDDINDASEHALLITLELFGIDSDKVTYETIVYEEDTEMLYFESNATPKLVLGFDEIKNPVFTYCNISDKTLEEIVVDQSFQDGVAEDVMFRLDKNDISDITSEYNLKDITYTNVVDRCNQYKGSLMRVVLLNSVISIFMLIIESIIIITIIKMEYMVNAKVLSIKKILGYSIFQKNRLIFMLNIFSALIGICTMIIVSLMYKITKWYEVLFIGIFLIIIECIIIVYNIIKLEKTSITKILKGGSL